MILVTGANGFIGQFLVPEIKRAFPKQKIHCLINKPKKKHEKEGLRILRRSKVIIQQIDLLDKKSLVKVPKKPRIIIHLAASVDTSRSNFQTNDIGTQNLYESLGSLDLQTKFIFISTAAVWSGRKSFLKPITESEKPVPNNEYGRTKLKAENFLIDKSKQDGFSLIILRLNTVYGADLRKDKLFGVITGYILKSSVFARVNWPGKFGIIHVKDVVKIISSICQQKTRLVDLFLVSTENKSLKEISSLIHQEMGFKYKPIVIPEFIWFIVKKMMNFLPLFEILLPASLYNHFWRLNLAVNDVLMGNPIKISKKFPNLKRIKFTDSVKEVVDIN